MLESIKTPFPECIKFLVENIQLDPHFKEFFLWARANNIPVVVISGGMSPIVEAILNASLGPEAKHIDIIANSVRARPGKTLDDEGGWEIVFRDER